MHQTRFGLVGTGMIAGVMANAMNKSPRARLVAVSGRSIERARAFINGQSQPDHSQIEPVQGIDPLLARTDVDALYIASPTTSREEIALKAIAAGKHILVEKPFADLASVERMTSAAQARGVLFMDATHFVHHPRTAAIRADIPVRIGAPRSLHTRLYFPLSDRSNIRFDPRQEPTGALGDLGWYSARAIVEYLQPAGPVACTLTRVQTDAPTGAILCATGLIAFESGEVSTFDVGFTAGTTFMDLDLIGTSGVFGVDDFVLDWNDSWSFKNPEIKTGYSYRTHAATRTDVRFIETPSTQPQEVRMIDAFSELVETDDPARRASFRTASIKTQTLLDAMRNGISRSK